MVLFKSEANSGTIITTIQRILEHILAFFSPEASRYIFWVAFPTSWSKIIFHRIMALWELMS